MAEWAGREMIQQLRSRMKIMGMAGISFRVSLRRVVSVMKRMTRQN